VIIPNGIASIETLPKLGQWSLSLVGIIVEVISIGIAPQCLATTPFGDYIRFSVLSGSPDLRLPDTPAPRLSGSPALRLSGSLSIRKAKVFLSSALHHELNQHSAAIPGHVPE